MRAFESKLGPMMTAFLDYRVALGYSRKHFQEVLRQLDKYIFSEYPNAEELSGEIVTEWMNAQTGNIDQKTTCVRLFAEYLNSIGHTAYVLWRNRPRTRKLSSGGKSNAAYIFTDDEMRRLFVEIDNLPENRYEPMMREMFPTMMRLTYTCGLRPGESRIMRHENINFNTGTILVTETKNHKERLVVMSPDMLARAKDYNAKREIMSPDSKYFFPKWNGEVFEPSDIEKIFRECWQRANPATLHNELPRVRIYDLRHRFATSAIIRWIDGGAELGAKLSYLQAFMGHAHINETLYYVHYLPEHFVKSSGVDWSAFNEIVPEVMSW